MRQGALDHSTKASRSGQGGRRRPSLDLLSAGPNFAAGRDKRYSARVRTALFYRAVHLRCVPWRGVAIARALSLAKLYQSTARLVEAHAALAPALEGFSPTPEMPEIAEAQALMERLA